MILLGTMRSRLAFGGVGLAGAVYLAIRGDWTAVAVVALLALYVGGMGVAEWVFLKGVKTPYDEFRLEGFGFAFAAIVFLLLAIALFTGLIQDDEPVVYGFVALGGSASALWVVVRVFRYPPSKYDAYRDRGSRR